ncbi:hypothetical protein P3T76_003782 [Phytophthora citrophthora]|uniref:Uncharacterized protein n=1 Tax=Phytophthora citrophthora TaxID=4793 RepID=A0AAD9LSM0_9STRA|nr:hypothetical protein P3T76_003782 [Phytophthora citrophthora]
MSSNSASYFPVLGSKVGISPKSAVGSDVAADESPKISSNSSTLAGGPSLLAASYSAISSATPTNSSSHVPSTSSPPIETWLTSLEFTSKSVKNAAVSGVLAETLDCGASAVKLDARPAVSAVNDVRRSASVPPSNAGVSAGEPKSAVSAAPKSVENAAVSGVLAETLDCGASAVKLDARPAVSAVNDVRRSASVPPSNAGVSAGEPKSAVSAAPKSVENAAVSGVLAETLDCGASAVKLDARPAVSAVNDVRRSASVPPSNAGVSAGEPKSAVSAAPKSVENAAVSGVLAETLDCGASAVKLDARPAVSAVNDVRRSASVPPSNAGVSAGEPKSAVSAAPKSVENAAVSGVLAETLDCGASAVKLDARPAVSAVNDVRRSASVPPSNAGVSAGEPKSAVSAAPKSVENAAVSGVLAETLDCGASAVKLDARPAVSAVNDVRRSASVPPSNAGVSAGEPKSAVSAAPKSVENAAVSGVLAETLDCGASAVKLDARPAVSAVNDVRRSASVPPSNAGVSAGEPKSAVSAAPKSVENAAVSGVLAETLDCGASAVKLDARPAVSAVNDVRRSASVPPSNAGVSAGEPKSAVSAAPKSVENAAVSGVLAETLDCGASAVKLDARPAVSAVNDVRRSASVPPSNAGVSAGEPKSAVSAAPKSVENAAVSGVLAETLDCGASAVKLDARPAVSAVNDVRRSASVPPSNAGVSAGEPKSAVSAAPKSVENAAVSGVLAETLDCGASAVKLDARPAVSAVNDVRRSASVPPSNAGVSAGEPKSAVSAAPKSVENAAVSGVLAETLDCGASAVKLDARPAVSAVNDVRRSASVPPSNAGVSAGEPKSAVSAAPKSVENAAVSGVLAETLDCGASAVKLDARPAVSAVNDVRRSASVPPSNAGVSAGEPKSAVSAAPKSVENAAVSGVLAETLDCGASAVKLDARPAVSAVNDVRRSASVPPSNAGVSAGEPKSAVSAAPKSVENAAVSGVLAETLDCGASAVKLDARPAVSAVNDVRRSASVPPSNAGVSAGEPKSAVSAAPKSVENAAVSGVLAETLDCGASAVKLDARPAVSAVNDVRRSASVPPSNAGVSAGEPKSAVSAAPKSVENAAVSGVLAETLDCGASAVKLDARPAVSAVNDVRRSASVPPSNAGVSAGEPKSAVSAAPKSVENAAVSGVLAETLDCGASAVKLDARPAVSAVNDVRRSASVPPSNAGVSAGEPKSAVSAAPKSVENAAVSGVLAETLDCGASAVKLDARPAVSAVNDVRRSASVPPSNAGVSAGEPKSAVSAAPKSVENAAVSGVLAETLDCGASAVKLDARPAVSAVNDVRRSASVPPSNAGVSAGEPKSAVSAAPKSVENAAVSGVLAETLDCGASAVKLDARPAVSAVNDVRRSASVPPSNAGVSAGEPKSAVSAAPKSVENAAVSGVLAETLDCGASAVKLDARPAVSAVNDVRRSASVPPSNAGVSAGEPKSAVSAAPKSVENAAVSGVLAETLDCGASAVKLDARPAVSAVNDVRRSASVPPSNAGVSAGEPKSAVSAAPKSVENAAVSGVLAETLDCGASAVKLDARPAVSAVNDVRRSASVPPSNAGVSAGEPKSAVSAAPKSVENAAVSGVLAETLDCGASAVKLDARPAVSAVNDVRRSASVPPSNAGVSAGEPKSAVSAAPKSVENAAVSGVLAETLDCGASAVKLDARPAVSAVNDVRRSASVPPSNAGVSAGEPKSAVSAAPKSVENAAVSGVLAETLDCGASAVKLDARPAVSAVNDVRRSASVPPSNAGVSAGEPKSAVSAAPKSVENAAVSGVLAETLDCGASAVKLDARPAVSAVNDVRRSASVPPSNAGVSAGEPKSAVSAAPKSVENAAVSGVLAETLDCGASAVKLDARPAVSAVNDVRRSASVPPSNAGVSAGEPKSAVSAAPKSVENAAVSGVLAETLDCGASAVKLDARPAVSAVNDVRRSASVPPSNAGVSAGEPKSAVSAAPKSVENAAVSGVLAETLDCGASAVKLDARPAVSAVNDVRRSASVPPSNAGVSAGEPKSAVSAAPKSVENAAVSGVLAETLDCGASAVKLDARPAVSAVNDVRRSASVPPSNAGVSAGEPKSAVSAAPKSVENAAVSGVLAETLDCGASAVKLDARPAVSAVNDVRRSASVPPSNAGVSAGEPKSAVSAAPKSVENAAVSGVLAETLDCGASAVKLDARPAVSAVNDVRRSASVPPSNAGVSAGEPKSAVSAAPKSVENAAVSGVLAETLDCGASAVKLDARPAVSAVNDVRRSASVPPSNAGVSAGEPKSAVSAAPKSVENAAVSGVLAETLDCGASAVKLDARPAVSAVNDVRRSASVPPSNAGVSAGEPKSAVSAAPKSVENAAVSGVLAETLDCGASAVKLDARPAVSAVNDVRRSASVPPSNAGVSAGEPKSAVSAAPKSVENAAVSGVLAETLDCGASAVKLDARPAVSAVNDVRRSASVPPSNAGVSAGEPKSAVSAAPKSVENAAVSGVLAETLDCGASAVKLDARPAVSAVNDVRRSASVPPSNAGVSAGEPKSAVSAAPKSVENAAVSGVLAETLDCGASAVKLDARPAVSAVNDVRRSASVPPSNAGVSAGEPKSAVSAAPKSVENAAVSGVLAETLDCGASAVKLDARPAVSAVNDVRRSASVPPSNAGVSAGEPKSAVSAAPKSVENAAVSGVLAETLDCGASAVKLDARPAVSAVNDVRRSASVPPSNAGVSAGEPKSAVSAAPKSVENAAVSGVLAETLDCGASAVKLDARPAVSAVNDVRRSASVPPSNAGVSAGEPKSAVSAAPKSVENAAVSGVLAETLDCGASAVKLDARPAVSAVNDVRRSASVPPSNAGVSAGEPKSAVSAAPKSVENAAVSGVLAETLDCGASAVKLDARPAVSAVNDVRRSASVPPSNAGVSAGEPKSAVSAAPKSVENAAVSGVLAETLDCGASAVKLDARPAVSAVNDVRRSASVPPSNAGVSAGEPKSAVSAAPKSVENAAVSGVLAETLDCGASAVKLDARPAVSAVNDVRRSASVPPSNAGVSAGEPKSAVSAAPKSVENAAVSGVLAETLDCGASAVKLDARPAVSAVNDVRRSASVPPSNAGVSAGEPKSAVSAAPKSVENAAVSGVLAETLDCGASAVKLDARPAVSAVNDVRRSASVPPSNAGVSAGEPKSAVSAAPKSVENAAVSGVLAETLDCGASAVKLDARPAVSAVNDVRRSASVPPSNAGVSAGEPKSAVSAAPKSVENAAVSGVLAETLDCGASAVKLDARPAVSAVNDVRRSASVPPSNAGVSAGEPKSAVSAAPKSVENAAVSGVLAETLDCGASAVKLDARPAVSAVNDVRRSASVPPSNAGVSAGEPKSAVSAAPKSVENAAVSGVLAETLDCGASAVKLDARPAVSAVNDVRRSASVPPSNAGVSAGEPKSAVSAAPKSVENAAVSGVLAETLDCGASAVKLDARPAVSAVNDVRRSASVPPSNAGVSAGEPKSAVSAAPKSVENAAVSGVLAETLDCGASAVKLDARPAVSAVNDVRRSASVPPSNAGVSAGEPKSAVSAAPKSVENAAVSGVLAETLDCGASAVKLDARPAVSAVNDVRRSASVPPSNAGVSAGEPKSAVSAAPKSVENAAVSGVLAETLDCGASAVKLDARPAVSAVNDVRRSASVPPSNAGVSAGEPKSAVSAAPKSVENAAVSGVLAETLDCGASAVKLDARPAVSAVNDVRRSASVPPSNAGVSAGEPKSAVSAAPKSVENAAVSGVLAETLDCGASAVKLDARPAVSAVNDVRRSASVPPSNAGVSAGEPKSAVSAAPKSVENAAVSGVLAETLDCGASAVKLDARPAVSAVNDVRRSASVPPSNAGVSAGEPKSAVSAAPKSVENAAVSGVLAETLDCGASAVKLDARPAVSAVNDVRRSASVPPSNAGVSAGEPKSAVSAAPKSVENAAVSGVLAETLDCGASAVKLDARPAVSAVNDVRRSASVPPSNAGVSAGEPKSAVSAAPKSVENAAVSGVLAETLDCGASAVKLDARPAVSAVNDVRRSASVPPSNAGVSAGEPKSAVSAAPKSVENAAVSGVLAETLDCGASAVKLDARPAVSAVNDVRRSASVPPSNAGVSAGEPKSAVSAAPKSVENAAVSGVLAETLDCGASAVKLDARPAVSAVNDVRRSASVPPSNAGVSAGEPKSAVSAAPKSVENAAVSGVLAETLDCGASAVKLDARPAVSAVNDVRRSASVPPSNAGVSAGEPKSAVSAAPKSVENAAVSGVLAETLDCGASAVKLDARPAVSAVNDVRRSASVPPSNAGVSAGEPKSAVSAAPKSVENAAVSGVLAETLDCGASAVKLDARPAVSAVNDVRRSASVPPSNAGVSAGEPKSAVSAAPKSVENAAVSGVLAETLDCGASAVKLDARPAVSAVNDVRRSASVPPSNAGVSAGEPKSAVSAAPKSVENAAVSGVLAETLDCGASAVKLDARPAVSAVNDVRRSASVPPSNAGVSAGEPKSAVSAAPKSVENAAVSGVLAETLDCGASAVKLDARPAVSAVNDVRRSASVPPSNAGVSAGEPKSAVSAAPKSVENAAVSGVLGEKLFSLVAHIPNGRLVDTSETEKFPKKGSSVLVVWNASVTVFSPSQLENAGVDKVSGLVLINPCVSSLSPQKLLVEFPPSVLKSLDEGGSVADLIVDVSPLQFEKLESAILEAAATSAKGSS